MKVYNQVEPQLASAAPSTAMDAGTAGRLSYHPAAVRRIGRVLRERYRLESLLGMGAMGEVYRATDLRLQQPCAVKLVFPGAVFGLKAHRRFINEARVVARLFHPNIVEVRDFSEDEDGTKFLVMELLEGQDLHEVLSRQGRLPLPRAMEIVRAVGAALQYAHDLGIVHRDVKPENIFLGTRGRTSGREQPDGGLELVKVLDFGLAKLLGEPTGEEASRDDLGSTAAAQLTKGIIIGTMAYLSPEATGLDSRLVDARSDQWSLAVVAYQLLSGRLPFCNPNPLGLWQMICTQEPVRLRALVPTIPEHIDRAIHTALAKDRTARFPRIADFIRSLGNLPQLSSVQAPAAVASAAEKTSAARPTQQSAEPAAIPGAEAAAELSEPTEVEPFLPGLTRPRLALLQSTSPGQRSVPEFVEPEGELRTLRIQGASTQPAGSPPYREPPLSNPDLLVTAHYTAEQLMELSRLASLSESPGLVHAAQDAPTAPYRLGARVRPTMDDRFDQTPLPVPRPLLCEPSVRVSSFIASSSVRDSSSLASAPRRDTPALPLATRVPAGDIASEAMSQAPGALNVTLVPSGDPASDAMSKAREALNKTLVPSGEAASDAMSKAREALNKTLVPSGEAASDAMSKAREALTATLVPAGELASDTMCKTPEDLNATRVQGSNTLYGQLAASNVDAFASSLAPKLPLPSAEPSAMSRPKTRSIPPRPPAAAFLGPRPSRPLPPPPPLQESSSVPTPKPRSFAAQPAGPAALSSLPPLPMPSLLTLNGTAPPELGRPLPLASLRGGRSLWHTLGAGSVVLGLVIAILLGLRLVRTRALSLRPVPVPMHAESADDLRILSAEAETALGSEESQSMGSLVQVAQADPKLWSEQDSAGAQPEAPTALSPVPPAMSPFAQQPAGQPLESRLRQVVKPSAQVPVKAQKPVPAAVLEAARPEVPSRASEPARSAELPSESVDDRQLAPEAPAPWRGQAEVGSLSD